MTLDDTRKWVDRARGIAPEFRNATESALIALDEARSAAESQVAKMQSGGAEAMRLRRESSGRVVTVEPYEPPDTAWLREWISRKPTKERDIYEKPIVDLCDAVDALLAMGATAPVPPARTSEPAAPTPGPTARCYLCGSNECIGFLHTTNGRNDYCAAHDPSAPKPGPTTPAAKFDAEAALVAGREAYARADSPLPIDYLFEVMLDAGRRGTR